MRVSARKKEPGQEGNDTLCALCKGFLLTKDVSEERAAVFCRGILLELEQMRPEP